VGSAPGSAPGHELHGLWSPLHPWLFSFITKIIYLTPPTPEGAATGQYYVLFLVMVTKFSDMGAYVSGVFSGSIRSLPTSARTRHGEGFAGALLDVVACGMVALCADAREALGLPVRRRWLVLGLLLGFAAVIGDLAESIVKRGANIKDSSHLLPGIGGTLDLIDSLLFTSPLLFFYMRLVLGRSMRKRRVVILGATGSIGQSALKVAKDIPDRMAECESGFRRTATQRPSPQLPRIFRRPRAACGPTGRMAWNAWSSFATLPEADLVLIAIVGTAGLKPALAAIEAGEDVAVASKEILCHGGRGGDVAAAQEIRGEDPPGGQRARREFPVPRGPGYFDRKEADFDMFRRAFPPVRRARGV